MVSPSKILTVSYGTFSCTLEGFDNPFETMRGIAEYFRDLAADDRHFGAEPPIPDTDMLNRIAQGDAGKPVVTRIQNNGVTLRQIDGDGPADLPDADPDVEKPAEPGAIRAESAAAKLARMRASTGDSDDASDIIEDEVFANAPISAAFADTDAEFADAQVAVETTPAEAAIPEPAPVPQPETETPVEPADTPDQSARIEDSPEARQRAGADQADKAEFPETPETEGRFSPIDSDTIAKFMGDGNDSHTDVEAEGADLANVSPMSRVVRMRRAEFDTATEDNGIGDARDEQIIEAEVVEPDQDDDTQDGVSTLSPEDEAELMANLAAVQRKANAEERSEKEGRALLENKDIESSGESVSRILEVTNTEMEETEGTRRRSAIAHLKAAVAATRADKMLTSKREIEDAEELTQYRMDLARIVKPRSIAETEQATGKSPLMLVSEQRVEGADQDADADDDVLPRRISNDGDGENLFVENYSFAKFAEEMDADDLTDRLEAAAAYSAYVQGQDHFSRPQIMQTVAEASDDVYSREEILRSFGVLLRRGKIKKLKRGQFVIADTTRFHPRPRAVGQ